MNVKFVKSFSLLIVSQRIHTGEKPYAYDICEMEFTEKGGLAKHKRIHIGVAPYKCEICKNALLDFSS